MDNPTKLKVLLTVTEASEALGLSRSRMYELLTAEVIPSVHIGRSRRIRVGDLTSYVDSLEGSSPVMTQPTTSKKRRAVRK